MSGELHGARSVWSGLVWLSIEIGVERSAVCVGEARREAEVLHQEWEPCRIPSRKACGHAQARQAEIASRKRLPYSRPARSSGNPLAADVLTYIALQCYDHSGPGRFRHPQLCAVEQGKDMMTVGSASAVMDKQDSQARCS